MRLWAAEGRGQDWKEMRERGKQRGREKVAKEGRMEGEAKNKLQDEQIQKTKGWDGQRREGVRERFNISFCVALSL